MPGTKKDTSNDESGSETLGIMTKSAENITCQHFEAELSAFVDGELQQLHMQRVVTHLDS